MISQLLESESNERNENDYFPTQKNIEKRWLGQLLGTHEVSCGMHVVLPATKRSLPHNVGHSLSLTHQTKVDDNISTA